MRFLGFAGAAKGGGDRDVSAYRTAAGAETPTGEAATQCERLLISTRRRDDRSDPEE
jgi:hypothetical protein